MRPKAQAGQRGFEVEWCAHLPEAEFGGADLDNATYKHRDFATKEEAEKFARAIVGSDVFGSIAVTEFVYEPLVRGSWMLTKEYIRDSDFIEAE